MTTVEDSDRIMGKAGRRLPGAIAIFLGFLVVGPLAGGATVLGVLYVLDAVPPDFAYDLGGAFFYSCLTVALPVAVVGALVATRQALARPVTAMFAAGLGSIAGVIWSLFLASEGTTAALSVLAFVGVIVATLVCWWLTRRLAGAK